MRVFVPLENPVIPCRIRIPPDKTRYLVSVMRVKRGDALEIMDGRGNAYGAEVAETAGRDLYVELRHRIPPSPPSPIRLILCQSLLKGQKTDLVVQKTTELGVSEIRPIIAGRSIPRDTSRIARWRKIAEEAAEQSGRSHIPLIYEPRTYGSLFVGEDALIGRMDAGLLLSTRGGVSLRQALIQASGPDAGGIAGRPDASALVRSRRVFIVVGPEGGFSAEEEESGLRRGLMAVSMGRLTLRAETAAIAAAAILQYLIDEELSGETRSAGT